MPEEGSSDDVSEFLQYIAMGLALEGNDQFRKDVGIGPFPCAKFLMVGFDVHVIIGAGEAGKKPDLPLPAILSVPYFADQFIRQIIIMLFLRPRQELDMPFSNAGFLTQFAKRCSLRFFALVNADRKSTRLNSSH